MGLALFSETGLQLGDPTLGLSEPTVRSLSRMGEDAARKRRVDGPHTGTSSGKKPISREPASPALVALLPPRHDAARALNSSDTLMSSARLIRSRSFAVRSELPSSRRCICDGVSPVARARSAFFIPRRTIQTLISRLARSFMVCVMNGETNASGESCHALGTTNIAKDRARRVTLSA